MASVATVSKGSAPTMKKLTPDEVDGVNERAREFLARINAVPEADRVKVTGDKFAGPIATEVIGADPEVDDDDE